MRLMNKFVKLAKNGLDHIPLYSSCYSHPAYFQTFPKNK